MSETDIFSSNCREELDGHVQCVKLFLEDHVKYGTTYAPGTGTADDHCHPTRQLYLRCAELRRKHPIPYQVALAAANPPKGPKPCEMELSMHGDCVARQLERTRKLSEKYWTQGGEDKCMQTRESYVRCMTGYLSGETDNWNLGATHLSRELENNVAHLHVNLDYK